MNKVFIAFAVAFLAVGSTFASDQSDVTALVKRFVDAFNKGDAKAAAATCVDSVVIIDEFPPYIWQGEGAFSKWLTDYSADAEKNVITDGIVTLGKPKHVDVSGNRAYLVTPVNYAFKQKGKPVKETGSTLTVALEKGATGWLCAGWAWAKN